MGGEVVSAPTYHGSSSLGSNLNISQKPINERHCEGVAKFILPTKKDPLGFFSFLYNSFYAMESFLQRLNCTRLLLMRWNYQEKLNQLDDKISDLSAKLAKIRESLGNEKRRASVLSQMLDSAKVRKPRNYLSPVWRKPWDLSHYSTLHCARNYT
jgi:hypothetical protein